MCARLLMTWADALNSVGEFASRNLCRPGWLELWVVLVLLLGATCCGCFLGTGWGLAGGYALAKYDPSATVGAPIKVAATQLSAAGHKRLSLYSVRRTEHPH